MHDDVKVKARISLCISNHEHLRAPYIHMYVAQCCRSAPDTIENLGKRTLDTYKTTSLKLKAIGCTGSQSNQPSLSKSSCHRSLDTSASPDVLGCAMLGVLSREQDPRHMLQGQSIRASSSLVSKQSPAAGRHSLTQSSCGEAPPCTEQLREVTRWHRALKLSCSNSLP